MEPKWSQDGIKIDVKMMLKNQYKKKTIDFFDDFGSIWGRFWTPQDSQNEAKTVGPH